MVSTWRRSGAEPPDPSLVSRLGLEGKRVVVFLGVLTPYQGVDLLLDVVPIVARSVPDVHFLILGYPNEERYRAQARERGLDGLGLVPRSGCLCGGGSVAIAGVRLRCRSNGRQPKPTGSSSTTWRAVSPSWRATRR